MKSGIFPEKLLPDILLHIPSIQQWNHKPKKRKKKNIYEEIRNAHKSINLVILPMSFSGSSPVNSFADKELQIRKIQRFNRCPISLLLLLLFYE